MSATLSRRGSEVETNRWHDADIDLLAESHCDVGCGLLLHQGRKAKARKVVPLD
jgi:hypothetical protein